MREGLILIQCLVIRALCIVAARQMHVRWMGVACVALLVRPALFCCAVKRLRCEAVCR